jgi:hypothetical protein
LKCGFCGDGILDVFPSKIAELVESMAKQLKSKHSFQECLPAKTFIQKDLLYKHFGVDIWRQLSPGRKCLSASALIRYALRLELYFHLSDRLVEFWPQCPNLGNLDVIVGDGVIDFAPPRPLAEPQVTRGAATPDFFHAFEGLIAHAGTPISRVLTQYIRNYHISETTKAHIRMLSALTLHLNLPESSTMNPKLQEDQENAYKFLKSAESEKDACRVACWLKDYDMDELDQTPKATAPQGTTSDLASTDLRSDPSSMQQQGSCWDVLHHIRPQNWITKRDRINSWLLQNLAAQPSDSPS